MYKRFQHRIQVALRRARPLAEDRRGVTSVVFAAGLLALVGTVGLATEVGYWYADYVRLQGMADNAATAAAVALSASETAAVKTSPKYLMKLNGLTDGQNGVTVTINNPPASGSYSSNSYAVEAIVSQTETPMIARLFMTSGVKMTARSIAMYGGSGTPCFVSLGTDYSSSNSTNTGQLSMSGGASLTAPGCLVASNNTGTSAVNIKPSPSITAYSLYSSGGINWNCSSGSTPGCGESVTLTKPFSANHVAVSDPLVAVQSVSLPSASTFPSTCTTTMTGPINGSGNQGASSYGPGTYCTVNIGFSQKINKVSTTIMSLTLTGGTYYIDGDINVCTSGCNTSSPALNITGTNNIFYINGGINVQGSATVNFGPGTYFLYNGGINVNNGGSFTCTSCVAGGAGITFVLMGTTPGTVTIAGAAPMTFNAPSVNNYDAGLDGIAIYQVPVSGGNTGTSTLAGSGTLNLQGAVYMPNGALSISGGAGSASSTCAVFVANTITMTGSGYASSKNCTTYGYGWAANPTPTGISLVQ
jgi:Flp pilus assembly protein TadG